MSWLQVTLSELLKAWGPAGLEAHVRKTQEEYWRRASTMYQAAQQVVCRFVWPFPGGKMQHCPEWCRQMRLSLDIVPNHHAQGKSGRLRAYPSALFL